VLPIVPQNWQTLDVICKFQDPNDSKCCFEHAEVIQGKAETTTMKKIFGWKATTIISFHCNYACTFQGITTTNYNLGYLYSGKSIGTLPTTACEPGVNTIIIDGNLVGSNDGELNPLAKKLSYSTKAVLSMERLGDVISEFSYTVKFNICEP